MGFWVGMAGEALRAAAGTTVGRVMAGRRPTAPVGRSSEEHWLRGSPQVSIEPGRLASDYYYWLWRLAAQDWPEERFMCGPAGLPAVTGIGWLGDGTVVVELVDSDGSVERFPRPPVSPPRELRNIRV